MSRPVTCYFSIKLEELGEVQAGLAEVTEAHTPKAIMRITLVFPLSHKSASTPLSQKAQDLWKKRVKLFRESTFNLWTLILSCPSVLSGKILPESDSPCHFLRFCSWNIKRCSTNDSPWNHIPFWTVLRLRSSVSGYAMQQSKGRWWFQGKV